MELPSDVIQFVEASFQPPQQAEALSLLVGAKLHDGSEPGERMLRCALVASSGNFDSLKRFVALLAIEYRDVILCGEYEKRGKETVRVRDLSEPLRPEV